MHSYRHSITCLPLSIKSADQWSDAWGAMSARTETTLLFKGLGGPAEH